MNDNQPDETDQSSERRVTLRDIAKELGISHVTVSKALRNLSGVSEKLKARIREKADEMGYVPDPLLASLSRLRTTSKTKPIQSELAWINTWEPPHELHKHKEFVLYREGAVDSARRLGYRLQTFNTAEIPPRRLKTILTTRNIQGILLPPLRSSSNALNEFDWSSFAVVRFGQAIPDPKTHFVSSAQIANTALALNRAIELGYKRVGFVCEYWRKRYFGAGYSWSQKKLPLDQQLPLLTLSSADDFESQQQAFQNWLQENRPDAILTDKNETLQMLRNLDYRIPEDIGLATTSVHDTNIDAGIDQNPYEIGRAAIRMLIGLIAEKSFGIPDYRNETLIEGKWVDGTMLPERNEEPA